MGVGPARSFGASPPRSSHGRTAHIAVVADSSISAPRTVGIQQRNARKPGPFTPVTVFNVGRGTALRGGCKGGPHCHATTCSRKHEKTLRFAGRSPFRGFSPTGYVFIDQQVARAFNVVKRDQNVLDAVADSFAGSPSHKMRSRQTGQDPVGGVPAATNSHDVLSVVHFASVAHAVFREPRTSGPTLAGSCARLSDVRTRSVSSATSAPVPDRQAQPIQSV